MAIRVGSSQHNVVTVEQGTYEGLDYLIRLGMQFDWISPTLAIMQDVANGGSRTFLIPLNCGWTGREIDRLLKRHGIKTWGLMAISDVFLISVHKTQGKQALRVLIRAGLG